MLDAELYFPEVKFDADDFEIQDFLMPEPILEQPIFEDYYFTRTAFCTGMQPNPVYLHPCDQPVKRVDYVFEPVKENTIMQALQEAHHQPQSDRLFIWEPVCSPELSPTSSNMSISPNVFDNETVSTTPLKTESPKIPKKISGGVSKPRKTNKEPRKLPEEATRILSVSHH